MYLFVRHDTAFKNLMAFRNMPTVRTGPARIWLVPFRKEYTRTWFDELHTLLADLQREKEVMYAS